MTTFGKIIISRQTFHNSWWRKNVVLRGRATVERKLISAAERISVKVWTQITRIGSLLLSVRRLYRRENCTTRRIRAASGDLTAKSYYKIFCKVETFGPLAMRTDSKLILRRTLWITSIGAILFQSWCVLAPCIFGHMPYNCKWNFTGVCHYHNRPQHFWPCNR